MSTAVIDYSKFTNAKSDAKTTSNKFEDYADELYSNIYKKLNSYSGTTTSNITSAISKAKSKYSELKEDESDFSSLATALSSLKTTCETVDKNVASKIEQLSQSFCDANNISVGYFEKTFTFLSNGGNSVASRWLDEVFDSGEATLDYLKERIDCWYEFEGGKELIVDLLKAAGAFAVAAIGFFIAAAASGPLALAGLIIATIGLVMTALSVGVYIGATFAEYSHTQDGDYLAASQASKITDFDDLLDYMGFESLATIWRVTEVVVVVAGIVVSIAKVATGISATVSKVGSLIKSGNYADLGMFVLEGLSNVFKKSFNDFSDFASSLSSLKNIIGVSIATATAFLADGLEEGVLTWAKEMVFEMLSIGGTVGEDSDYFSSSKIVSLFEKSVEALDGNAFDQDLISIDTIELPNLDTVDLDGILIDLDISNISCFDDIVFNSLDDIDITAIGNIEIPTIDNINISQISIPDINIETIHGLELDSDLEFYQFDSAQINVMPVVNYIEFAIPDFAFSNALTSEFVF